LKRSVGETSEAIECLRGGAGGRARARPRQLLPRLRRDADRARTASPSNQIWNGKGYGQRPADFSGVSRRCCLVRERTSRVAPIDWKPHGFQSKRYRLTGSRADGNHSERRFSWPEGPARCRLFLSTLLPKMPA
jgi:hypothetical protein